MTSQRETAEKLVEPYTPGTHPKFYTRNEVIDLITAALEQSERAGYVRGIEAAAKLFEPEDEGGIELENEAGDALVTRRACECIAHAIRALKDVKP